MKTKSEIDTDVRPYGWPDTFDLLEQWRRWEEAATVADIQVRVIELATGVSVYSETWPGGGRITDFDGRYLIYEFPGIGHDSKFSERVHLIDTSTGNELPINWGSTQGSGWRHIRLFLPTTPP